MQKKFDAVCVGTCLLDISTTGMQFDTFLHTEPNLAEKITFCPGGDAVNEAIVLHRLGHSVALMSRVGDDFVGRFLLETAAEEGLETGAVRIVSDCPTEVNNILIGENDQRVYTISRNATSRTQFCEEDLDYELVAQARLVAFGSIFVHEKFDGPALEKLFRTAKEHGAITCADVGPTQESCSLEPMKQAMPYLDYFFANDREAALLSGKVDIEAVADYFLSLGIGTVIIKSGAKGSLIKNAQERIEQCPFYVEPVDTTGAGDNYAAGFMSGLLRGLPLAACAKFASATGALAVGCVGATAGVKSAAQVEAFLADREKK